LNHSGVGLGMSIAEDIARSHGGNIELNESIHKGLQVRVSLPL
jgi:two-component system osmolarity sensor histidine kinase EnvZ